ncbi:MAG TPA: hypothetical protein PKM12_08420, partial [Marmoricola sp.]|nr:hypothetical protein [Marmoricola sp.]
MLPARDTRVPRLLGALAALAIFTALAGLVYWQWAPLQTLDDWFGRWPQQVTTGHDGLAKFFRTLGHLTDTKSQTVITTVIVIWLLLKKQHRAAIWTAGLMITIGIAIPLLKRLVRRERPTWDDPVTTLSSFSFPSGHAMGIAGLVGISIVLSVMLVRKR